MTDGTDDTMRLPPVRLCAASGCNIPVITSAGGPPAIYCSPACRPSGRRDQPITVDIAHPDTSPDGRPTERVWTVTLRRGSTFVVIAADLGWPSANALARSLDDLLAPPGSQPSGARGGRPQPAHEAQLTDVNIRRRQLPGARPRARAERPGGR